MFTLWHDPYYNRYIVSSREEYKLLYHEETRGGGRKMAMRAGKMDNESRKTFQNWNLPRTHTITKIVNLKTRTAAIR